MQLNDPESICGEEDCRFALRVLETEAYCTVVNALRAQGSFSQYYHLVLEHLRIMMNVSIDRHKAEIRRAVADPILLKIASGLNPDNDVTFEWSEEGKRTSGNSNFPSALAMESPSFYRFSFMRTCKNDVLLELADHLATFAVQHNRSKSASDSTSMENGEEAMFQTLKRPKLTPSNAMLATTNGGGNRGGGKKANSNGTTTTGKDKTGSDGISSTGRGGGKLHLGVKRKSTAAKEASMGDSSTTDGLTSPRPASKKSGAGRPRKQSGNNNANLLLSPKQRLDQLLAARSAAPVEGTGVGGARGGSSRAYQRGGGGRGGKKFTAMTKAALTAVANQQRMARQFGQQQLGQGVYHQPSSSSTNQFYQFYAKSPPKTPPRQQQMTVLGHQSSPPVVNNRPPGSAQKTTTSSGRQVRKRTAFTPGPVPTWSTGPNLPGRVPISPLSAVLPAKGGGGVGGGGAPTPIIGPPRYYTAGGGPSTRAPNSPTRSSLSGEAPGVYADDYNANALDSDGSSNAQSQSDQQPMQPHQFFSAPTYFNPAAAAATTSGGSTPAKTTATRKFIPGGSPAILGAHMIPSATRITTGISVKPKSAGGNGSEPASALGGDDGNGKSSGGGFGLGTTLPPMRQATGQKLIVLPSALLRRAQSTNRTQPNVSQGGADMKPSTSQQHPVGKQQSLIILRRAPSLPSAAAAVSLAATNTTTSIAGASSVQSNPSTPSTTPAPTTPSNSPPEMTQDDPK